jgi:hypothetical protein
MEELVEDHGSWSLIRQNVQTPGGKLERYAKAAYETVWMKTDFIMEADKATVRALKEKGILTVNHNCGKMMDVFELMVSTGVAWNP